MHTLFKAYSGSMLYGTQTPTSDIDTKGVFIPSEDDLLYGAYDHTLTEKDLSEDGRMTANGTDETLYSLKKFMDIASGSRAIVSTEMLLTPDNMILETSSAWKELVANRMKLITNNAYPYVGFIKQKADIHVDNDEKLQAASKLIEWIDASAQNVSKSFSNYTRKLSDFLEPLEGFIADYQKETGRDWIKLVDTDIGSGTVQPVLHIGSRQTHIGSSLDLTRKIALSELNSRKRTKNKPGNKRQRKEYLKDHAECLRIGLNALELFSTGNITFPVKRADEIRNIKLGHFNPEELKHELTDMIGDIEHLAERSGFISEISEVWVRETIIRFHRATLCRIAA